MAGRSVGLVAIALLLAALVVRVAAVEYFTTRDSARAATFWPGHPAVVLTAGLTQVGADAAVQRPVNTATIRAMLSAAAYAPLAPEPYLVRGVDAQTKGNEALAFRAYLEARRRAPRSVAARYFLADHYLRTGQTADGLTEISALTRLVPRSLDGIAPYIAAFARTPDGPAQVRALLDDQPQLEPWLLNALAANASDSNLALSLWNGRTAQVDHVWQDRLLDGLVEAGRFEEARSAWYRFDPAARTSGLLADPKFSGAARPPFGWTLASGPAGFAEGEDDGRLHILYYGRDDLVLAQQLLMLPPGHFRFAMRVERSSGPTGPLSWTLRCLPGSRVLASIPLKTAKNGSLNFEMYVPAGCPAQRLELAGTAPELPEQADLNFFNLSLSEVDR